MIFPHHFGFSFMELENLSEVDDLFRGQSNPPPSLLDEADDLFRGKNAKEALSGRSKAPNLLNLILWRRSSSV